MQKLPKIHLVIQPDEAKKLLIILDKTNNRCTYPDPDDCRHYCRCLECCLDPDTNCSYHKEKMIFPKIINSLKGKKLK